MDKLEATDVAVGAVGSEGERGSCALSSARDNERIAPLAPGQRWSLSRKLEAVLRLMQGEPLDARSKHCPADLNCRSPSSRSGAAASAPSTGQTYGVKRVCAIWGVPRSSFYDAQGQEGRPQQSPVGRCGPKTVLIDAELLAAIRHDLDRSLWTG